MEHLEHADDPTSAPTPERQGATSGASNWTPNLPLLVWLRGDEPYFTEFSLDADMVMQQLGIKRSRLTQISGTELRVGRTRIDRYIRPVYRPCDVEEYRRWTRATASHVKSSNVLEQAAHKLEVSSRDFSQQLEFLSQEIQASQAGTLQHHSVRLLSSMRLLLQQASSLQQRWHQAAGQQQHRTTKQLLQKHEDLTAGLSQLTKELTEVAALAPSMEDMLGMVRYVQQSVLQLQQTVAEQHLYLLQMVQHLQERLLEMHSQQQRFYTEVDPQRIYRMRPLPQHPRLTCYHQRGFHESIGARPNVQCNSQLTSSGKAPTASGLWSPAPQSLARVAQRSRQKRRNSRHPV